MNFIFDINKCVGCQACVVACSIENGTSPLHNFRQVYNANEVKLPGIPVFNLSLACNHCGEAACVKNCPSTALSRDEETGAVWVNHDKCIGCQYCVWSCPFDVPKFNHSLRMVEKCNWCLPKVRNNENPNCVNLCPTGALAFNFHENEIINNQQEAFPGTEIKPKIDFIDYRYKTKREDFRLSENDKEHIEDRLENELPVKISALKEWTLLVFTLVITFLSGQSFAGNLTGEQLNPLISISLLALASVVSILHIGRKERAYRAVSNLKSSWLSREIFLFGAFAGILLINLVLDNRFLAYFTTLLGFSTLFAVEMIYKVAEKKGFFIHSSNLLLTGVLIGFYLSMYYDYVAYLILVKVIFYYLRKLNFSTTTVGNVSLRIIIVVILLTGNYFTGKMYSYLFLMLLLIEIFDRIEFYNQLVIKTPKHKLLEHLKIS